MSTLIAYADGNLTGASTFKGAETGASALAMIRNANIQLASNTALSSPAFTITNLKVIEGVLLWVAVGATASPGGTLLVELQKSAVTQASVTINVADLPHTAVGTNDVLANPPIFFKFTGTATGDGTANWTLKLTTSNNAGAIVNYWRNSATGGDFTRALRTATAATPAAGDDLYIVGELTGAGTHNTRTVTMDSTAATAYGNGTVNTTAANGGGVRVGNYGTLTYGATGWNTLDKDAAVTLSGGNLTATGGVTGDVGVRATGRTSGKYYVEFTLGATWTGGDSGVGLTQDGASFANFGHNAALGAMAAGSGNIFINTAFLVSNFGTMTAGAVVGMAVDLDTKLVWFRVNGGTWWGGSNSLSGDPVAETHGGDISAVLGGVSKPAFPTFVSGNGSSSIATINLGASAFSFSAPSGYSAWGTAPAALTNYVLRVNGDVEVYWNGTLSIGASGAEMPRSSTAVLELQMASATNDFGLQGHNLSTVNVAGLSRTSGKNVVKCKLTADVTGASIAAGGAINTGVTATQNGGIDVTGISSLATSMNDQASNTVHVYGTQQAGLTFNLSYVAQMWLARGPGTNNRFVRIFCGNNTSATTMTNGFFADVDLQAATIGTCTAVGTGTATSASIQAVGSGYLCTIIGKVASSSSGTIVVGANMASAVATFSFLGSATVGLYIEGIILLQAASISDTTLNVDTDTGWLSGDAIAVAATTRTSGDCEDFVLSANAGASSLVTHLYPFGLGSNTTSVASTHSGTAPTAGEIGLLTRNVKIRSTSSTLWMYTLLEPLCTATFSWAQVYYAGANTANKFGFCFQAGAVASAKSFTFCSFHDTFWGPTSQTTAASLNAIVQNCVMWNQNQGSVSFTSTGANGSSDWTIDNCLAIKAGQPGFSLYDFRGTCTNNTAVGTTNGFLYSGSGNALGTPEIIGTFSGNVAHSCSNTGLVFNNAFQFPSGSIANFTAWRMSGNGIQFTNGTFSELTFDNLTLFGNTTRNILVSLGDTLIINGGTIAADASFATTTGIDCNNNNGQNNSSNVWNLTVNNVDFSGTGTGLAAHTTSDIGFASGSWHDVRGVCNNCKFGIGNASLNKATWGKFSYIGFERYNQTAGDHRFESTYGQLRTDPSISNFSSPSMRMTPSSASKKLESAPPYTGKGLVVPVSNGNPAAISAYIYKSKNGDGSAYNGNQPRLIQRANSALGQNSDVVLATYGSGTGSWNQISGNTSTPTDDGAFEIIIDCDGTQGWINVDDFQAA